MCAISWAHTAHRRSSGHDVRAIGQQDARSPDAPGQWNGDACTAQQLRRCREPERFGNSGRNRDVSVVVDETCRRCRSVSAVTPCAASASIVTRLPIAHSSGRTATPVHPPDSIPVARTTMSPALTIAGAGSNATGQASAARRAQSGCHDGTSQMSTGSSAAIARHAAHSACRSAADRRRNRGITHVRDQQDDGGLDHLRLLSRLARSTRPAMRSSSSREMPEPSLPSSASTTCSGEPWKNVSSTCFSADRLAMR